MSHQTFSPVFFLPHRIKGFLEAHGLYPDDLFEHVEIETASRCNRKCPYCPNSIYNRGNFFMPEPLFQHIIKQLAALHFSGILRPHFYNEPLLDKRLPQLVRFAKTHLPACRIHLFTNGDYLTKPLLNELLAAGVDEVFVTGHEGKLGSHIKQLARQHAYKNILHTSVISKTQPLFNRGGLVQVKKTITAPTCQLAAKYLVIDYRGNVVLCCNDYLSSQAFGNLAKERIIDIWRKPNYARIRRETKRGIYRLDICRRCMGIN